MRGQKQSTMGRPRKANTWERFELRLPDGLKGRLIEAARERGVSATTLAIEAIRAKLES